VTEVIARWEQGIARNSHTLELQELGGFSFAVAQHRIVLVGGSIEMGPQARLLGTPN
jgi:hypothetical protein